MSEREVLGEGRFLRLVCGPGRWEWAERRSATGVVVVIAVTAAAEVLLVEQWRHPVAARVIELPAGLAGDVAGQEQEELAEAARRELEEETGYTAERLEPVLCGPSSAGLSNELLTVFKAHGVRRIGAGGGDASEDITVHHVPLPEVEAWLAARMAQGALVDPKVYAALWFARGSRP